MTNRTIKHEIKLQPSVIAILGLLALGVCAYAFSSAFSVKKADAAFSGGGEMIVGGGDAYSVKTWQLKGGKVRFCGVDSWKVKCSDWKE